MEHVGTLDLSLQIFGTTPAKVALPLWSSSPTMPPGRGFDPRTNHTPCFKWQLHTTRWCESRHVCGPGSFIEISKKTRLNYIIHCSHPLLELDYVSDGKLLDVMSPDQSPRLPACTRQATRQADRLWARGLMRKSDPDDPWRCSSETLTQHPSYSQQRTPPTKPSLPLPWRVPSDARGTTHSAPTPHPPPYVNLLPRMLLPRRQNHAHELYACSMGVRWTRLVFSVPFFAPRDVPHRSTPRMFDSLSVDADAK